MSKGEKVCLKQEGTKRESGGEPRENHEKKHGKSKRTPKQ